MQRINYSYISEIKSGKKAFTSRHCVCIRSFGVVGGGGEIPQYAHSGYLLGKCSRILCWIANIAYVI